MVEITVVMITKRKEPRIDWFLESLVGQTFTDFECILVDGFWNKRKEDVKRLIDNIVGDKFKVLHIPDKASRWRGQRPCVSNARNTAIIFANGKYIVHADDNCKMPNSWLGKHVGWLEKNYIVAGNWKSDISSWEYRSTIVKEPRVVNGGWLYGANMGFPLEAALEVNCFDELYDGELGQDDMDMGIRAERKGYKIIYDPSCYVEYDYKDHGLLMAFHEDPNSNYWKGHTVEFDLKPVNIMLKDGKYHFSNEFLMQELLEQKDRFLTRGNTIQIRGTREMFGTGNGFGVGPGKWKYSIEEMFKMMESFVDGNPRDWRDNRLITEKLKEQKKIIKEITE